MLTTPPLMGHNAMPAAGSKTGMNNTPGSAPVEGGDEAPAAAAAPELFRYEVDRLAAEQAAAGSSDTATRSL